MATVLLTGTVVLSGAVIASGDGDHALSSSASTSSPLTGIDLNDTLGLYTLTSASAPFSLTEQTTIIGPTEDVDGNALTWSHQVISSSDSTHQVQFVAEDGSGNSATLTFTFESSSIPSSATVTEQFSVSQTSNSFVVSPPVFELPPSIPLALGSEEDFNGWTDTDAHNTSVSWNPNYNGYMYSGSFKNGNYHPSEHGLNGQGTVVAEVEVGVTPNQQYTVSTNSQFWNSGGYLNGPTGSMVRFVDTANYSNYVTVVMDPGPINSPSYNWVTTSETFTPTGNIVKVEVLAPAGEQYIESISITAT